MLRDISEEIKPNEVVCVIGPSGSGKSTLLRCATMLEKMDDGELIYLNESAVRSEGGKSVYSPKAQLKKIQQYFGLVFQNFNLFPHYSVIKNIIDAPVHVQKRNKKDVEKEAKELLSKMGLTGKENYYPCQLSGGQQQRVAIARALAAKPAIILADEPTGNLDSATSQDVMGLLKVTSEKFSQTVVMITHNEEIAQMADRIIRIEDGRIVVRG